MNFKGIKYSFEINSKWLRNLDLFLGRKCHHDFGNYDTLTTTHIIIRFDHNNDRIQWISSRFDNPWMSVRGGVYIQENDGEKYRLKGEKKRKETFKIILVLCLKLGINRQKVKKREKWSQNLKNSEMLPPPLSRPSWIISVFV